MRTWTCLLAVGLGALPVLRWTRVQSPAQAEKPGGNSGTPQVESSSKPPIESSGKPSGVAIDRWREALELDLAHEIVDEMRPLVERGGALATDGRALELAARARFATGDVDGARALLANAKPEPGTRAFVELAKARLALELDELAPALAIVGADAPAADSARFPEIPECWLLLGRARVRAGDARGALEPLQRFVRDARLDVEAPAAWHMLAQSALQVGDLALAERCRKSADASGAWQAFYRTRRLQVRAHPEEPLPRLGLAQLWMAVDENQRAKAVLDEITARWPTFARGPELLGEVELRLGDRGAGRKALDRALELDPELVEARIARAAIAVEEKRFADAEADLARVVDGPASAEPRALRAHLELARVLGSQGKGAAADQRYARYRELGGKEPR